MAFVNACRNGNKKLVLSLMEKNNVNYTEGLINACLGGHKEIALLMIIKGADINKYSMTLEFDDIHYLQQYGVTREALGKFSHIVTRYEKIKQIIVNAAIMLHETKKNLDKYELTEKEINFFRELDNDTEQTFMNTIQ